MLHQAMSTAVAAGILVAAVVWSPMVSAEEATYVGHQQCKVCHSKPAEGEQWVKWSKMQHAKAFELLKTDEALEVAKKVGLTTPPSESPDCLKCHVTAYNEATGKTPAAIKFQDGVQCESCHGPSSEHLKVAKVIMFQPEKAEGLDIMGGRTDPSVDSCLQCHNKDNPTWREDRYTLADGTQTGFDFEQAWAKIQHHNPNKKKDAESTE